MDKKYVIEIDEDHPFVRKISFLNDEDKAYVIKGTSLIIHEEELKELTTLDDYVLERFDVLGIMSYETGWGDCDTLWRNYFDTFGARIDDLKKARLEDLKKEKAVEVTK